MIDKVLDGYEVLFPIGTPVKFFQISGEDEFEECVIRSKPWRLGHGQIVINVTGRAGGVHIDHIAKRASLGEALKQIADTSLADPRNSECAADEMQATARKALGDDNVR